GGRRRDGAGERGCAGGGLVGEGGGGGTWEGGGAGGWDAVGEKGGGGGGGGGGGPDALRTALDGLCRSASHAVGEGARIVILSDPAANRERAPLPMLLAVGAVHQHLLEHGSRTRLGLIAEAGDAWDVHHFAALIGYGAEAVHPWLALESVQAHVAEEDARGRFRAAAEAGLLKILSKMGISTLSSYCGAQIFEALGLGAEVIDRCFTRAVAPIPLDEVEPAEAIRRRFVSTAMSLGALSPEAHRTLAIGMNRMGARSNSGEGGEDPDTYAPLENGDRVDNRIKQVASGRF